jgi:RimJ/RimL family protein N-acetyltransferase
MEQSERLVYSPPFKSDFERYYQINSDPQTNLFNPAGAMDEARAIVGFERFMKHWELFGFGSWTIREKSSGTIIGFGGISKRMYGAEEK